MKQFRISSILFYSALAFLLTSCGGGEDKTTTDTMSSDTAAATSVTPAAPATTVVTTPENMMQVIHKVSNFTKWKPSYDAHDSMRLANGIHSYVIGRGVEDSNTLLVVTKVEDMAKAKAFAKDASLKNAMQKGGVVGKPKMMHVTMVFQDTATISSDIRSMSMFSVKDWDSWKKSFEEHKQTRLDNGLSDRAYGYDADDNHKVILVLAVTDTAKANAFWDSDLLKQRRAESGVVGQPERFVYRIVQKY
jgi:hypothetical protein